MIAHAGCWENTRKGCKSLASTRDLQAFRSSVLPASQVGYHAGKPIERVAIAFIK